MREELDRRGRSASSRALHLCLSVFICGAGCALDLLLGGECALGQQIGECDADGQVIVCRLLVECCFEIIGVERPGALPRFFRLLVVEGPFADEVVVEWIALPRGELSSVWLGDRLA